MALTPKRTNKAHSTPMRSATATNAAISTPKATSALTKITLQVTVLSAWTAEAFVG
jgi:hypothetical protein